MKRTALISAIVPIGLLALGFGCNKSADAPPAPGGSISGDAAKTAPGEVEAGKTAFNANCARCHGNDGSGGKQGPDLAHAGADATKTQQWFIGFIKNPKSQKPNTKMPGFEGKIQESDISSIAAWLVTHK